MSARLLKKVLKEKELAQFQQPVEEDDEEGDGGSPDSGSVPAINPFDLLNDGQDDSDQENEPEAIDETSKGDSNEKQVLVKSVSGAPGSSTSSSKSKKKKKKKSKAVSTANANKVDERLDEELEMLSLGAKTSGPRAGAVENKVANSKTRKEFVRPAQVSSILRVDPKHLNPENELRRIFGSKVVKSIEKDSQASSSRQIRGGRRGNHHTRKTILVSPSEHWHRWDGSLTMEFLETKEGLNYFSYTYSPSYSQAQRAFEAAKAIHDLNGIASILLHHPYHLDSLVTMADYFKFVGEHQMSADAIGKCLYAFECAWHPMFTPLQGNCQLKISHEANKPIFTTLFSHMRNLDRRGCHRSALEVCKLLLALDSDDPTGAMFCIDYFALRAKEYAWLEQFAEDYRGDNSLWLFPNFSYSLAICRLYLEQEEESSKESSASATKASSSDLMKQALMLHPSVLRKLVAKVPLKDRLWTDILKHAFFKSEKAGSPSLDHLINLYVERSYLIWRLPDIQKLLKDTAMQVMETLHHNSSEAEDWACVRKQVFSSDKNEYDYLMVSDFSDMVATLPPENLQEFMVDPRMAQPEVQNGNPLGNQVADGHPPAPRDVANRNALAVLVESILPWAYYGDPENDENNQVEPDNED
ncbi:unnamed protein product [Linum trigynum]|uniref:Transcription factor 25 n=1 Tax=Linum trigynum TaxID=586398 RepID=A0AAV2FLH6_9ROSI